MRFNTVTTAFRINHGNYTPLLGIFMLYIYTTLQVDMHEQVGSVT